MLVSYYASEGLDGTEMLNLAYLSLKALQNEHVLTMSLIRRSFELRLLAINGDYSPELAEEALRYTCRYICTAPLTKLYAFTITDELKHALALHADRCIKRTVDRRIKSREILEGFIY
jgi:DNA repair protein RecO (recombination protein O)